MNNPYHIFESLGTIFCVQILKFFDADPGWKKFGSGMWDGKKLGSGIRDKHPGSDNTEENLSIFVKRNDFSQNH
jgi:hypothetical protein